MTQVLAGFYHESFKLSSNAAVRFEQKAIELLACRNDWAACSLVIAVSENAVLLKQSRALFSEKGPWPVIRVTAECPDAGVCAVRIAGRFMCEDDISRADILLDDDAVEMRPWLPVQLFLTLTIPAATQAGLYRGSVKIYLHRLFEDETLLETLAFSLRVYPVLLPATRRFFLNLWQHPANIARKHEVGLFSDDHFAILEEYMKSLQCLGNKVATVIASEAPWSGQACFKDDMDRSDLFEYNYIRVYRNTGGTFTYDFSNVERYVDLCDRYGIAEEIGIFGLIRVWQNPEYGYGALADDYPDAIRICYMDRTDGSLRYLRSRAEIQAYIRAFHDWLKEKNWLERSVIIADEPPDMLVFRQSLAMLREAGPGFKIQVDVPPAQFVDLLDDRIEHYTPLVSDPAESMALYRKIKAQIRGRVQLSVCCWPPFPNQFLRSPLLETHLMAYLTEFLGADGFLRWNYTVWPQDPRRQMVYRPGLWESGDTCFVYPSRGGHCLLSLRYFALKRCVDLFELIGLVKDTCKNSPAILQQAYDLILREQDYTAWTFGFDDDRTRLYSLDAQDYDKARQLLIEALADSPGEPTCVG